MLKVVFVSLFSFMLLFRVYAQELILSSEQIEAMFLENNLELIAEKMNISIADAAIAEAKVWDNPELSIGDINMWQKGNPKQFSVELSQMFSLSARRAKLADVERTGKEITIKQFEELLRSLKVDLRVLVSELHYTQNLLNVLNQQRAFLADVVEKYQSQSDKGNISKSELIRLQTALIELEGTINGAEIELNSQQSNIKTLLSIDPLTNIIVANYIYNLPSPSQLDRGSLIEKTLESRPDIQGAELQSEYHRKDIKYQKAVAVPDLSLGVGYDRYGGVWDNFIGVGVGIQIPIFNRNKGAIKTAQIQLKQNDTLVEQSKIRAQNEVIESLKNYTITYRLLEKSTNNSALKELDGMLKVYADNLLAKNISLIEYMDFMDSYRSTKQMVLNAQKELVVSFEQLQYLIGQDIK